MNIKASLVFLFIVLCLVSVGVFSFVAENISDGGDEVCLKAGGSEYCIKYYSISEMIGFDSYVSQKEAIKAKLLADSLQKVREHEFIQTINSLADTVKMMEMVADNDSARFWLPSDDRTFWDQVFSHWESLKDHNELYRILHYGDSQIEMDRITAYLRSRLQHRFGGSGPGLVPPLQLIPSNTVLQTASDTWRRYISYGIPVDRANHRDYGVLGMIYYFDSGYAHAGISVRMKNDSLLNNIDKLKILTGKLQSPLALQISSNSLDEKITVDPSGDEHLTTVDIPADSKKISLTFRGDSNSPVLAIALDGKSGIVMDNIPWRGSSGLTFIGISQSSLRTSYQLLDVKMVVMQFGGNSVPYLKNENAVLQYANGFKKQIDYLRSVDSTLKIIVIGPGDMSYNNKGVMNTYPVLESVVREMKRVSTESGAAFWSMYDAMGGENSMPEWVDAFPALAAPDYIHFTERGADIISEVLYKSIMKEYEIYRKKKQLDEEQQKKPL